MKRDRKKVTILLVGLLLLHVTLFGLGLFYRQTDQVGQGLSIKDPLLSPDLIVTKEPAKMATLTFNGDHLYHNVVYLSGQVEGGYDFSRHYQGLSSLLSRADFSVGNFEGTIHPDLPLSGYPLFNAPKEVATSLKDAGYDLMSLVNNHMLDSGLEGLETTKSYLEEAGLQTFGLNQKDNPFVVEINGIRVAFLAYTYGCNGLEAQYSEDQLEKIPFLDSPSLEEDIRKAKTQADFLVVYPHAGIEYQEEPPQELKEIYYDMVTYGADVVMGNHPHVVGPSEWVVVDGQKKLICYSMGNLLSNQNKETLDDIRTQRGLIVEVVVKKEGDQKAILDQVIFHPTMVVRQPLGKTSPEGIALYDYQVVLTEDYINQNPQQFSEDILNDLKETDAQVRRLVEGKE